jgi:hypothetical protein
VNQSSATVVIGIPTVRRERNYLLHTVKSIIEGISPSDRNHCRIVILDGDVEPADNPVLERIKTKWPELIASGWITIWRSTHSFDFSSAENLKQRWQWKQTFDCAELFRMTRSPLRPISLKSFGGLSLTYLETATGGSFRSTTLCQSLTTVHTANPGSIADILD